jgi:hypothetical protein
MVGDAVENVLKYLDRYNPELKASPFAYITTICYFAFLRRIADENKQSAIKGNLLLNSSHSFDVQTSDINEHFLDNTDLSEFSSFVGMADKFKNKSQAKTKTTKSLGRDIFEILKEIENNE